MTRTWLETIKMGKVRVLAELDRFGISYNSQDYYFRLCSKLYRHEQAREQTRNEVADFVDKTSAIAETYNLKGQMENRYWKSCIVVNERGERLGRVWQHDDEYVYDTKAMRYSSIAVSSISEAVKAIGESKR